MAKSELEKKIQADIMLALGSERDLLLLRNSTGQAEYFSKSGRSFRVPYGLGVGSPDLVCLLTTKNGYAAWFCLEVKQPGKGAKPEQRKCHDTWRSFGAMVYVVHSVEEAKLALFNARLIVNNGS